MLKSYDASTPVASSTAGSSSGATEVPLIAVPYLLRQLNSPSTPIEAKEENLDMLIDLVSQSFGEDGAALGDVVRRARGHVTLSWLLCDPEASVRSRALFLLANLSSDTVDHLSILTKRQLLDCGCASRLLPCLSDDEDDVVAYACAALQNLASSDDWALVLQLHSGALSQISQHAVEHSSPMVQSYAAGALRNCLNRLGAMGLTDVDLERAALGEQALERAQDRGKSVALQRIRERAAARVIARTARSRSDAPQQPPHSAPLPHSAHSAPERGLGARLGGGPLSHVTGEPVLLGSPPARLKAPLPPSGGHASSGVRLPPVQPRLSSSTPPPPPPPPPPPAPPPPPPPPPLIPSSLHGGHEGVEAKVEAPAATFPAQAAPQQHPPPTIGREGRATKERPKSAARQRSTSRRGIFGWLSNPFGGEKEEEGATQPPASALPLSREQHEDTCHERAALAPEPAGGVLCTVSEGTEVGEHTPPSFPKAPSSISATDSTDAQIVAATSAPPPAALREPTSSATSSSSSVTVSTACAPRADASGSAPCTSMAALTSPAVTPVEGAPVPSPKQPTSMPRPPAPLAMEREAMAGAVEAAPTPPADPLEREEAMAGAGAAPAPPPAALPPTPPNPPHLAPTAPLTPRDEATPSSPRRHATTRPQSAAASATHPPHHAATASTGTSSGSNFHRVTEPILEHPAAAWTCETQADSEAHADRDAVTAVANDPAADDAYTWVSSAAAASTTEPPHGGVPAPTAMSATAPSVIPAAQPAVAKSALDSALDNLFGDDSDTETEPQPTPQPVQPEAEARRSGEGVGQEAAATAQNLDDAADDAAEDTGEDDDGYGDDEEARQAAARRQRQAERQRTQARRMRRRGR